MEESASIIYLRNLRLHAFHGVLPQERTVGNDYIVNVEVCYPIESACLSDDVSQTLNYAELAEVVTREMQQQSNLLENVAHRIGNAIRKEFPLSTKVTIDIQKVAPPMSVDCDGAGIKLIIVFT